MIDEKIILQVLAVGAPGVRSGVIDLFPKDENRKRNTELLTPCALDVNRNFDLHVFSRAGPVAAATNLADKSAHPVLENRCHILIAHSTTAQHSEVLA